MYHALYAPAGNPLPEIASIAVELLVSPGDSFLVAVGIVHGADIEAEQDIAAGAGFDISFLLQQPSVGLQNSVVPFAGGGIQALPQGGAGRCFFPA